MTQAYKTVEMRGPLDPQVLERAKTGDRQALTEVLEHHYVQIHRMLVKLVGPVAEVEDLRQSVLLQVVQGLPRFRGESALSTWIGGICVNVSRAYFRSKKLRALRTASDSEAAIDTASSPDPVSRLESRDNLTRSEIALRALSPEQRAAFLLASVYGHSIEEIATMMGAARSTTRLRLYYGRKKFFREMADEAKTKGRSR